MMAREQWRKSSYTGSSGNCVEVAWRKSSYTADSGNCVEVAWPKDQVAVRDSKQPAGPTLSFPASAWHTFLTPPRHSVRVS
jgi:uncharacterized protein DUF397